MKKRIVSALLALTLMVALLPIGTIATDGADVVYLSVSYDGEFKTTADGTPMACVSVERSKLETIDLDEYGLSDYKYDADGDGRADITALHLYIWAQENLMGIPWNGTTVSGAQGSIYFETGLFGFPDANLNYYYNGSFPVDEELSAQWGYTVGATADRIVLQKGDYVDVAGFSNDSWMIYSATFRYFFADSRAARTYDVTLGETLTVTLGSMGRDWSTNEAVVNTESGSTICYSQTPFASDAATVTTDDNGQANISFDQAGKWYIWSLGYNDGSISCSPAYAQVNVKGAATSDVTADWHNFRNSEVNMALTGAPTPTGSETAVLKWAQKLGTGWSASPSVQIIVDNALVVMCGNKNLYKLDLQTGEILQETTMTAAPNFGYTPATYGNGLIFCPLSGGTVQAFDAKTLESRWTYQDALGGQSLSPITYADGYLYTGFWNGETKDANYVCINAADGSLVWSKTVTGGFYWAGSVVLGDALIVGTDDGQSGYSGDSHLLSLNKKDGSVISDLTLTGCGDQRSSIAYSEAKGRVYFTAKNGYLCSAAVDMTTGGLSDLKTSKQASQCTSTPVVYGDQVYFSCGSGVMVGSGGSGNFVVADADTLQQHYVVALKAYPQGSVLVSDAYLQETGKLYCYSTYNGQPGGLSLIKVDPTVNTAEGAELVELYDAKGYEQYCITSPICGKDGTIYYKNDSGYILAVGTNTAYLSSLTADTGKLTGEFKSSSTELEWVVPVGTEQVTFAPVPCDGGSISGDITVSLADGTATASILVMKNDDSRRYTISIREVSTDASLSELKVNEKNSYSGSALALSPAFTPDTHYYTMLTAGDGRSFENIWPTASDANAALAVYPISNVAVDEDELDAQTGAIKVTATNQKHDRYAIYFEDDTKAMAVRIEVTAEDGSTGSYVLVMSKAAAAEDGVALLAQIQEADRLAADQAAAQPVMDLIDAIGEVTLSSADAIEAARTAYDGLTEEQKAQVSNYVTLTAAEERLEAVKDEATANPVDIYVSIADKGNMVLFQQSVTVTDVNNNGWFDVDDALYAAHEAYYEGGATAGYQSYSSQWGMSIGMLWGDTSLCYGYWLNNASCWSLEDVVSDGNHLVAFVYTDGANWSDAYSRFDRFDYTVTQEEALTVKLDMAGYDANWNTVFSAHAGAYVSVYDSEGCIVTEGVTITDNNDGSYHITFSAPGNYFLTATDSDPLIVPAVCRVTVEKSFLKGDVNGDGDLNSGDVANLYAHIKGTITLTDEYALLCADLNSDGQLNIGDVAMLYAHVKGTTPIV